VAPFQCLYLRDKVYALLGLIRKDLKDKITVEYDSSVKTDRMVILEATTLCFLEQQLLLLQYGQVDKDDKLKLPSWCPDWTSKPAVMMPFTSCGFSAYPTTSSFHPPAEKWLSAGDMEKPTLIISKDKESLFFHGFIVDKVDFVDGVATEETPEVPAYSGDDDEKGVQYRAERLEATKKACLRWEQQVENSKIDSYPDSDGGYKEAFCRTICANRNFARKPVEKDVRPIFDAWIGREEPSETHSTLKPQQEHIKDFNKCVVGRCIKRAFITTTGGRFGLAPMTTLVGDLVCIWYSGAVAYIVREPPPELGAIWGSFVGEAYVHGIMQGEYLEMAKVEDFRPFWLK
jgi:hypothetical protein